MFLALLSCGGTPGGGPGSVDIAGSVTETDGSAGPGGLAGNPTGNQTDTSSNPATRPTPGFTELEMRPATSTSLPAPGSFLKSLNLIDNLIGISEVRMFLRDLKLADGSDFFSGGPFIVRLIQNNQIVDEAFPGFGSHAVTQGDYGQLDLGLEVLSEDQIPAELQDDPVVDSLVGHSIVVEGTFKGPVLAPILGQLLHFRFVSHQIDNLRIETPNAFTLNASAQTLFVAFKVKTWLDLNLASLLQDLNVLQLVDGLLGVIVIDTDSSDPIIRGIALQLEANIDTSLRFALSPDALFDEGEVDETSFSDILP